MQTKVINIENNNLIENLKNNNKNKNLEIEVLKEENNKLIEG
jgi:hypothetical protein